MVDYIVYVIVKHRIFTVNEIQKYLTKFRGFYNNQKILSFRNSSGHEKIPGSKTTTNKQMKLQRRLGNIK